MKDRLLAYKGKRVFMEYRKASGDLTERIVKIVKVTDADFTVWCEKRNGLRRFKFQGVINFHPLLSATEKVN